MYNENETSVSLCVMHGYLSVFNIGLYAGISHMLFAHNVFVNALLCVPCHKQSTAHLAHVHSLSILFLVAFAFTVRLQEGTGKKQYESTALITHLF